jgi:hypothetical protein
VAVIPSFSIIGALVLAPVVISKIARLENDWVFADIGVDAAVRYTKVGTIEYEGV